MLFLRQPLLVWHCLECGLASCFPAYVYNEIYLSATSGGPSGMYLHADNHQTTEFVSQTDLMQFF